MYIREAHPTDGRRPAPHVKIEQPRTYERRKEVAGECCTALKLTMPVLVDDMRDTACNAYNAWPDRLFILAADGKIAYRGGRGPGGFKLDEVERSLKAVLSERRS